MSDDLVLGRWKLGDRIGGGGFGQVFDASDGSEAVAVKLVRKLPGAERELLLADLPPARNVIPVLESGEHDDSWVLVMPRAEGSLRDHLNAAGGHLPLSESIDILKEVCDGLVDLEGKVVHRDLKPENILLWDGRWCLADFGISRYAEATTAPDTRKYAFTPPYAAPERWRDDRATISTDVYSVGVMAFEITSGRLPFEGPDFRDQHLHRAPPQLTEVPAPMGSWIEECLFKAPESRPSPTNLRARLDRLGEAAASEGLSALQEASRAEVVRLGEEARKESEAKTEAERRSLIADAGESLYQRIAESVRTAIESNAPAATRFQAESSRPRASRGWGLQLSQATLMMTGPVPPLTRVGSIDLILSAVITVQQSRGRNGYRGRSHSLWYCDAQTAGQYGWYETAFMRSPLLGGGVADMDPFSLGPGHEATEALSGVMGGHQVAWPFTPLHVDELDEFIDRWGGWFATASSSSLSHPTRMPERSPSGSWRRGST